MRSTQGQNAAALQNLGADTVKKDVKEALGRNKGSFVAGGARLWLYFGHEQSRLASGKTLAKSRVISGGGAERIC